MIFGNPIRGFIRGPGAPRIVNSYRVTQAYGCTGVKDEPKLGSCLHFHRGLDIGDGTCGDAVVAAQSGTVRFAGKLGNGEIVVMLNHGNGWGTSYGHLASKGVSTGATVVKGQRIGAVGDTGFASGCHLHFAVKSLLPPAWNRLDFIPNALGGRGDSTGQWQNPWPLLEQNIRIHPQGPGINIRATPGGELFAHTDDDGEISRVSDGTDLGPIIMWRDWNGTVKGPSYNVGDKPGDTWESIWLDGDWRWLASPLAVLSAQ